MAPPEMRGPPPPIPQQGQPPPQQPLTETVASITNSGANQGANHHMIQHHTFHLIRPKIYLVALETYVNA